MCGQREIETSTAWNRGLSQSNVSRRATAETLRRETAGLKITNTLIYERKNPSQETHDLPQTAKPEKKRLRKHKYRSSQKRKKRKRARPVLKKVHEGHQLEKGMMKTILFNLRATGLQTRTAVYPGTAGKEAISLTTTIRQIR